MKSAITTTVLLVLLASVTSAQDVRYFPNLASDHKQGLDDFRVAWYSSDLKAMGEPSLVEMAKTRAHVYRFLWLRSFHNPIAVRLNVDKDGTSLLTVKVTNGRGSYPPGALVKNETRRLSKDYTQGFLDDVRELDYWGRPTDVGEQPGLRRGRMDSRRCKGRPVQVGR